MSKFAISNKDAASLAFIEKATKKHGDYCDYSKTIYINAETKIIVICKIHGEFSQIPRKHIRAKRGCPKCSRAHASDYRKIKIEDFIADANLVHNYKYNYSKVKYNKITDKIEIICSIHGTFYQAAISHLSGHGCTLCGRAGRKAARGAKHDLEWFVAKSLNVHGHKYDYSKVEYKKSTSKIKIICPEHGEFEQVARQHLNGNGCKKCALNRLHLENMGSPHTFLEDAGKLHINKYDYSKMVYYNNITKIKIICPEHGEFEQTPKHHLRGQGCPECNLSAPQLAVIHILRGIGIDYIINNRDIIKPLEIDLFIPNFKLGIEVNGNYWHSYSAPESQEEMYRHARKLELASEAGISLIQFWEHEIIEQMGIVKSIIMHKFGLSGRTYARRCNLIKIDRGDAIKFYITNHIQGFAEGSHYGLIYNNEVLAMASFRKLGVGKYELARFSNKLGCCVVGGMSKLIRNFIKESKATQIISYADRRFGNASSYKSIGFKAIGHTKPGYKYCKGLKVFSRQKFQKLKLSKLYDAGELAYFNPKASESANMFANGYRRMWDAGHYKLVMDVKK